MDTKFLNFSSNDLSTRSDEVYEARQANWYAHTPYGLCILRHSEAGQLLRDRRLRQGSYSWTLRNGMQGSFGEFWQRSIISQEGPIHKQMRNIMVPALSPEFIEALRPQFYEAAESLIQPLMSKTTCEFMSEFTIPFAGKAICALLGLSMDDWATIASDASDLGLGMGVDCKGHEATCNAACDRVMTLSEELIKRARSGHDKTSYIARLVTLFDAKPDLPEQALRDMIVISIFGGVDTTKAQLGFLMVQFIQHPDQWQILKDNPELAPNAIEESIRNRPTTTWITREAIVDFTFQDVEIKKATTLHILSHATSTDPITYASPSFDITAKRKTHFGFGGGAHHCIGHLVARTDMSIALGVLTKHIKTIEFNGTPEFLPDSGNTSPISLPFKYTPE
jgi:cytochrome P450